MSISSKIPTQCLNGRDIATEMRTRHRRSAPIFRTVEEKLEHVAAGHGFVLLPMSTAVFYTRPGVAYSHVSDIPPNQVCLAWDATGRSLLIQDFAAIAADHPPVASPTGPRRTPRAADASPDPGSGSQPTGTACQVMAGFSLPPLTGPGITVPGLAAHPAVNAVRAGA
jgi:hypothetical protein